MNIIGTESDNTQFRLEAGDARLFQLRRMCELKSQRANPASKRKRELTVATRLDTLPDAPAICSISV